MAKRGDEGLRVPVAERRMIDQPFADRRPSRGLDHIGLQPSFIQKDQALQMLGHEGLTQTPPDPSLQRHIRARLFSGLQVFFCD